MNFNLVGELPLIAPLQLFLGAPTRHVVALAKIGSLGEGGNDSRY
jgi:hypothetical protein